jgi:hypothetical protein
MVAEQSTDSPPDLPESTDARWRFQVLRDLAECIISSLPCDSSVANAGTPSAWLSVSKDGVQIARIYANRGVPQKERTKFTVVAGSEATKTDCFGTTKIVWLLKHADGQLQEDNYESFLPRHLAYLQPLSERGDRVRCDMDLFATVKSLTGHERGDLVELYRQVVASDHKDAIDS